MPRWKAVLDGSSPSCGLLGTIQLAVVCVSDRYDYTSNRMPALQNGKYVHVPIRESHWPSQLEPKATPALRALPRSVLACTLQRYN